MPDIAGWRVAYSLDFGYKTIAPDVRANTLSALETFRALGCTLTEVEVPWDAELARIRSGYLHVMWGKRMRDLLHNHRDELSDYTIRYAEVAEATPVEALHLATDTMVRMSEGMGRLLDAHEIFVCPTTAVPAVAADHDPYATGFAVEGVPTDPRSGWIMTYPFNMLSRLPVMALPSGRARNGVPTGIQVVARSHDDHRCFQAAYAYERAVPRVGIIEVAGWRMVKEMLESGLRPTHGCNCGP